MPKRQVLLHCAQRVAVDGCSVLITTAPLSSRLHLCYRRRTSEHGASARATASAVNAASSKERNHILLGEEQKLCVQTTCDCANRNELCHTHDSRFTMDDSCSTTTADLRLQRATCEDDEWSATHNERIVARNNDRFAMNNERRQATTHNANAHFASYSTMNARWTRDEQRTNSERFVNRGSEQRPTCDERTRGSR